MSAESEAPRPSRRLFVLLPLAAFLALSALFLAQLLSGRDAATIPSALIGAPAPVTDLPPLPNSPLPGLSSADFKGKVTLVNVWASWCAPCREEQPVLLALSQDRRFDIAGLNYKDKPENALRFLGELGNPFTAIGADTAGRTAIDWGVYGVPETFLVGPDGTIILKHVGPLSPEAVATELIPAIEKALAAKP
jgi:cytochrome c biogenesis protein CcmG/thiol:disulfide interchange protein DsbE